MTLQCELDGIKAQLLAALGPEDRQALEDAIERLRMLQLVEHGLPVGDVCRTSIYPIPAAAWSPARTCWRRALL
jgi:hypothetical protein